MDMPGNGYKPTANCAFARGTTDADKKAYAAALVLRNSKTAAFKDVFGDDKELPSATLHYYAAQLGDDPVVIGEVEAILNARTDARAAQCRDIKRLAINSVGKLAAVVSASHTTIIASLLGAPASAVRELPEHLQEVIESCSVREFKGELVITRVKLHDPVRAAEVLGRWVEFVSGRQAAAHTAESEGIAVFPDDRSPRSSVFDQRGKVNGNGRIEVSAHDIG